MWIMFSFLVWCQSRISCQFQILFEFYWFIHGLMISEKISTKIIENDLPIVAIICVVVQFLRKKTCVLTEMWCVFLAFIFPGFPLS